MLTLGPEVGLMGALRDRSAKLPDSGKSRIQAKWRAVVGHCSDKDSQRERQKLRQKSKKAPF